MKRARNSAGVTLVEIIVAMLVITLVAAGMLTAFAFSRGVTHRSSAELSAMTYVEEISEQLRGAVGNNLANGLTLTPGIYVDAQMQNAPVGRNTPPAQPTQKTALDLPNFTRFLTSNGTAQTWADHGDGRVCVVENAPWDQNNNGDFTDPGDIPLSAVDIDGDGLAGIDFNNDGITDLRRVRVKVRFTTPTAP